MKRINAKTVAFCALMAALANLMSIPPLAIPLPLGTFTSSIHFSQLAIFLSGILAGPWAGLISGAIGSLYMGVTRIPFIVGGIALLGGSAGLFARRMRPTFACSLAWLVQAPYVLVTDYIWFTSFVGMPSTVAIGVIVPIMVTLTLEAIISAVLADVIVHYVKRAGIKF
ncbi:MAG TPA: ECF transporter S component [Candidatus Bathyarchaeia archaeon]|nr:ECF transporter S component [Candidatus Bathyarchaeia archaeon]